MKSCYICRFSVIEGKCEAQERDWHKEAKKDMDQKINAIKTQRADNMMEALIF